VSNKSVQGKNDRARWDSVNWERSIGTVDSANEEVDDWEPNMKRSIETEAPNEKSISFVCESITKIASHVI
jgi:hypothetical protein